MLYLLRCQIDMIGEKMHTVNLEIESSFYPHFKVLLESFERDKKIKILDQEYKYPQEIVASNVNEVQTKALLAEERIKKGTYLTQEQYDQEMDDFFSNELGLKR